MNKKLISLLIVVVFLFVGVSLVSAQFDRRSQGDPGCYPDCEGFVGTGFPDTGNFNLPCSQVIRVPSPGPSGLYNSLFSIIPPRRPSLIRCDGGTPPTVDNSGNVCPRGRQLGPYGRCYIVGCPTTFPEPFPNPRGPRPLDLPNPSASLLDILFGRR